MLWRGELALRFVRDFVASNTVADPGPHAPATRPGGSFERCGHGGDALRQKGHRVSGKGLHDAGHYDVVILSDIGSNSFLLAPQTFARSESSPNRLRALAEYVEGAVDC
jgi:hypothetical protein